MGKFLEYVNKSNKKKDEESKSSSTTTQIGSFGKYAIGKTLGLDTLHTDLTTLSKTIGNVYNGWQTQETMKNTLSSVQSMYNRLGKYQEYQKTYGGVDLSELQSSYKSVLDGWEDLSKQYGRYKSADEYTAAIKSTKDKLAEEEKMKTDDLGVVKTEIADMEKIYNTASDMTKNLSKQSLNVRSVSDAQRFKNTYDKITKDREAYVKSMGYESYDALEKALGNKKTYLNRAEWVQKGIELATVGGEDFEEKSKYVAPEEKGFGIYRIDEEEERYKYINDEDYRLEYSGSVNDSASAGMLTVGYEYMTDQEKKAYNYYYNSGDKEKAKEYLNTITESLSSRKAMADFEGYEGKTFKELAYGVNAGLNQFMSGMKNLTTFSDEYIPVDATQQLSGMIRDDLNYEHGKWGTVPYDFITTTSNMLPSILTSSLVGKVNPGLGAKVGATLMGASASGNAYQEMLNLGYDKTQARVYSGLVGLSEAGLQSAIGGISKLGGIGGKSTSLIKSIDNAFGRFAVNYGKSIVAEGFEEAAQEVLDPIFKSIVAGYDTGDKVDWGEVVYSGLLGMMSGGFWEGGPSVSRAMSEVQAGKDIKSNERVSDLFDIANNPEIAEAYETYTRYANKGINTENVSNAQLGRLYNEVKADAVGKVNSKKSTDEQYTQGMATLGQLGILATENKLAKSAKENAKDLKVGAKSDVDINDVKLKDNEFVVSTDKGEVSVNDVNVSKREAELLGIAKEIAKTEGEELANAFIAQYDGETDIYAYHNSFNVTMAYAKGKYSYDYILNNKGVLSVQAVKEIYKETRIKADKEQKAKFQELVKQMADKKFYKGFIDESAIDYDNTSAEGKVNWKDLTQKQREAVTFVKGFAQATGMNLVFVADNPKYNGSYDRTSNTLTINLDKGGYDAIRNIKETIIPTMSHETTHWMKEKSPELWRHLNEIVFSTLTEHYNSNTEQAIKDKIALLDRLDPKINHTEEDARERNITEKDLIQAEMNRKKDNTEDVSREEIIARTCEDLLKMSEQGRKIFSSLSEGEQKTLFEKVKAIITDVINWVNDLLNFYEATSTEARIMREYKEQLQKASKVWDKMLEDSVKVNQALEKSGAFEHESAVARSKRYSIKETSDGIQYVVLDKNLFLDEEGNELTPRQAYNSLVGQKIELEDGDVITFIKNLPGRRSVYNELFKKNPAFKDDINIKAISESINKNIVESITASKISNRNEKQRHNHLGVIDFDSRKVYVTDGNEAYELKLSIANLTDGKKIAYAKSFIEKASSDILTKIKKAETVRKSRLNQLAMVEQASKSAKSTTNNIILNSDKNVNTKISDKDTEHLELFGVPSEVEEKLSNQIDTWLQGKMPSNEVFKLGKTPVVLKELGADDLPIVMAQDVISKINGVKHEVSLENVRNLPKNIADPIMIFKSATVPNAFVILTEMEDMSGRPIMAALHLNKAEKHIRVNRITSVYGKDGIKNFITTQTKLGNLKYIDKIKSQNWSQSRGLQLPKLADTNPDNNIILYKEDIVNTYNMRNGKELFSEKEQTSIYDLMGENERLLKENEKYKADVERLKERLKIEKTLTHGNRFNENQLGMVAGHLRNISNSTYDKLTLMRELKDVYSHIITSEALAWEDIFGKCYRVAENMLKESKPEKVIDDYSKHILRNIRSTKIRLSDVQKAEAQHIFGKNWNRYFFNRVVITDSGTPIDMQWSEWADMYPDLFDRNISDTDMIGELYDIIGSLQDASEVVMEYDAEERTRWLAREIYNQYWNVSTIKTTADKYDRKIKELNHAHRNAMVELRDDYNNRLAEQKKLYKQKNRELVAKIRERKDKEIAMAKQHGRDMMSKYKENAERKTVIQRITSNSLGLNEMLVKNSKDKHIPEFMKATVIELLSAINFSSKRMLEKGIPTEKDMRLANALRNLNTEFLEQKEGIRESLVDFYGSEIDKKTSKLAKTVDGIIDTIGDNEFILNKMSVSELKELDEIIKTIKTTINRVNKFHVTQHNAGVESLGIQSTIELKQRKKVYKDNKKHFDKLKTKTYWNNLNPFFAFKNLGPAAQKIFKAFQDGLDKLAFLTKAVIDFTETLYSKKEYEEWNKKFFDFEVVQPNGDVTKFSMNVPQIMSLYCVSKQEDALMHILHGSQVGTEIGKGRGITLVETSETEAVRNNILLTNADLQKIIAKLDNTNEVGRAKEVADKLQEYMCTVGAELGNEISMARWDIKSFGIENYFPIKVSRGQTPQKGETPGVQNIPILSMLNRSFTHSRNKFAGQSIEIGDIFDVFSSHMAEMIEYNAMALPVLDAYKWMNCHGVDENGNEFSVSTSIIDTFGDNAWEYLNIFMKDINSASQDTTRDKTGSKFFRNAKVAKVAFKLRVAILQFTSFIRAGAVMDNKYLLKAFLHTPKIQMSKDHCGIALWKSLGYFDTDITRPLTDKIKHAESKVEWVRNLSLWGAGKVDEITLGYLWNACELEVRNTRKDLRVGSEEFNKEIGNRLRDVIYQTQVVDSTMTRSQMMRGSAWDKMLTSFASENTLSFNLVTDMYVTNKLDKRVYGKEYSYKKNKKRIRKIITAYAVLGAVTAVLQSVFDAFMDFDEEDKDEEYIAKLMVGNFAKNVSFIEKIPYINLITSFLSGFSASRMDADWMEKGVRFLKQIPKVIDGDEGSGDKAFRYLLDSLSSATGIGAYAIYQQVRAFLEMFDYD